ncbi:MAG: hypothetical protein JXR22_07615 [Prolixibacteraceae bacterium]|nr:hypothetical protein [Prolixibacteraceae bacterium]
MDARVKAIIAHLTPVGWIVALLLNLDRRDELSSFFIRQTLGLWMAGAVISWIPVLNIFGGLVIFAFWILSLVYAAQGTMKTVPFGEYFQVWFSSL